MLSIILFLANYYNNHKDELDNQWTLLKPILLTIIIFLTVAMQPDFGTAFVIFGIVILIFYHSYFSFLLENSFKKGFNKKMNPAACSQR